MPSAAAGGADPREMALTASQLADTAARSGDPAGAERFRQIADACAAAERRLESALRPPPER